MKRVNEISFKYGLIDELITSKKKIKINHNDTVINTTSITNIAKQLKIKTNLKFRGIKLVYLSLKKNNTIFPDKTDFVYFDDPKLIFNRISDQNSFIKKPMKDKSIYCCEVTYSPNDKVDKMSSAALEKKSYKDFYKLSFVQKIVLNKLFLFHYQKFIQCFFKVIKKN